MVWALFPDESLRGEHKYYIFSKGTYKVGRRGCDVIVNTDKGVSRIHAELLVASMNSIGPLQKGSTSLSTGVCVKDCSKYGTFINKNLVSKIKIHEYPDKVATVKDGDLLSFGTGNATYRFCSFPLIFFVYCLKPYNMDRGFQEEISSIGARATSNWSEECTHVLVDDFMPVKADLLDSVVAQKPIILRSWFKAAAEKNICTELPGYAVYVPTVKLEGFEVKLVDQKARENCLAGYTFLLGAADLYKFDWRLKSLLYVGGAKVLSVDEFCTSSQASEDGADNRMVLVIPSTSMDQFNNIQQVHSLPRVNEMHLLSAVLSGSLDPSNLESASILVSSSCSTDETIVADSDVEGDTVSSDHAAMSSKFEETRKQECMEELSGRPVYTMEKNIEFPSSKVEDGSVIERRVKSDNSDTSGNQHSDILYCPGLIVRDAKIRTSGRSTTIKGIVNFKCFKKGETQSGNSFRNLIPFAKHPYKESDTGSEVAEQVQEEKKQKQIEAIAEDLFNTDKPRKRGIAGSSLHGLLTRG